MTLLLSIANHLLFAHASIEDTFAVDSPLISESLENYSVYCWAQYETERGTKFELRAEKVPMRREHVDLNGVPFARKFNNFSTA